MATYQTRHLEATREIAHGDKLLKPGETFHASEVDAEHYIRKGHAKVVTAPAPAPAPTPAPARAAAAKPVVRAPAAKSASATRAPAVPVASSVVQASDDVPTTPTAAEAPATKWERTEPIKLEDVPHPDAGTPPAEG